MSRKKDFAATDGPPSLFPDDATDGDEGWGRVPLAGWGSPAKSESPEYRLLSVIERSAPLHGSTPRVNGRSFWRWTAGSATLLILVSIAGVSPWFGDSEWLGRLNRDVPARVRAMLTRPETVATAVDFGRPRSVSNRASTATSDMVPVLLPAPVPTPVPVPVPVPVPDELAAAPFVARREQIVAGAALGESTTADRALPEAQIAAAAAAGSRRPSSPAPYPHPSAVHPTPSKHLAARHNSSTAVGEHHRPIAASHAPTSKVMSSRPMTPKAAAPVRDADADVVAAIIARLEKRAPPASVRPTSAPPPLGASRTTSDAASPAASSATTPPSTAASSSLPLAIDGLLIE